MAPRQWSVHPIPGDAWTKHVKAWDEAQKKIAEAEKKGIGHSLTSAELKRRESDMGEDLETRRRNAQKLIQPLHSLPSAPTAIGELPRN